MAKCELPSGAWVEYREQLKAKDRFAAQDAAIMSLNTEGDARISGLAIQNSIRNALLASIITQWSYDHPVPSKNDFVEDKENYIGEIMDLDDYNYLAQQVEPLMTKVAGTVVADPKKQPAS